MYMFHCEYCGTPVQQYFGYIDKIYPYIEPYEKGVTVTTCRGCRKAKYTFQTHKAVRPQITNVILHHSGFYPTPDGRTQFFCHNDRRSLLIYDERKIVDLVNHEEKKIPFDLTCPSETCQTEYYFKEQV